jgi:alkanesulfonate monooxygenase SsuD/methylene tetrahydromethanopterin reductase-like flavin-dependent oxidoreductase (luciferase family)
MRFGFMLLPRGLEETREVARSGDAFGFEWMGVADSPTVYQESYLHQLEAARQTERIKIGPVASHVVARHPVIVANLLATFNEFSGGRGMAALATGNSAARGLGLKPATVAELRQGVEAIRAYWRGEGGEYSSATYRDSTIPATGLARDPGRLLVAADGPKAAALAGEVGDGLLYGGTLEPDTVRRRFDAGRRREGQEVWVGPSVSVRETVEDVREELGAMIIAMANRAFRGDLDESNVPADIQADVRQMWERYDYAFHADTKRPHNVEIVTPALSEYLIEHFCIWGPAERWRERLDWLGGLGCDGVMFILGQADQAKAVREIAARLEELGALEGVGAAESSL